MKLYDHLGIKPGASKDEIKRAYRNKSRKTHPDHGGDAEEFKVVSKAYKVLSDDQRRARYDNGEDPEQMEQAEKTDEQEAQEVLARLLAEIITQNVDVGKHNLIALMRRQVEEALKTFYRDQGKVKDQINRVKTVLGRLRGGIEDTCPLRAGLKSQLAGSEHALKDLEKQARIGAKALVILAEYSYDFEQEKPVVQIRFPAGAYRISWDTP